MKCVVNCEFLRFSNNIFTCSYHNDEKLEAGKNYTMSGGKDAETVVEEDEIIVHRCSKCIEDGIIGTNTMEEEARKLKKHVGWMADSFYSFKDTFEESLTEVYRILKKVEGD